MRIADSRWIAAVFAATLAVACGDDGGSPPQPDSTVDTPDANVGPDAAPSPVQMISCAGENPTATISTSGFAFSPNTATINAGEVLRFMPAGPHNMTAGAPGAPTGDFATPTSQETCLRFNQAGSFSFFCSVHPTMTGTITVN